MRIAEGLHLVGGGYAGFGLSGEVDANCYAVDTGAGVWLFDVGLDSFDQIVACVEADGLDPASITHVFVTHHHADHAGALGAAGDRLPGATIAISAEVADGVRAGAETANGLAWAREIGYYPADFRLSPARVDVELEDGWSTASGAWSVRAVTTPGHCVGHIAFLVEGPQSAALLSGDQVFCDGKIGLQNLPDVSVSAVAASMRTLSALEFTALLPGHGRFTLDHGPRHVAQAAGVFDRIGLPPNLF